MSKYKGILPKIVTNLGLIFIIMIYDLIQVGKYIYEVLIGNPNPVMVDWFGFAIKVVIAIILFIVLNRLDRQQRDLEIKMFIWDYFQEVRFKEMFLKGKAYPTEGQGHEASDQAYLENMQESFREVSENIQTAYPELRKMDVDRHLSEAFPFFYKSMIEVSQQKSNNE